MTMMMATTGEVHWQPPTSRLPPIAQIATCTTATLVDTVRYLQSLYRPHVRGSRRRRGHDDPDGNDTELSVVRADAFERAYAIRWLTALIAHLDTHTASSSHRPIADTDALIQQTAALLATCAGVAAAGTLQRQFTFAPDDPDGAQVLVDVTDLPLDNHDYGSVGAQTWGGACVLAEMIVQRPQQFGLAVGSVPDTAALRILELGAGTGLVGLTVAKLLSVPPHYPKHTSALLHPRAIIVLTDFYPAVLDNLQSNIVANFPSGDEAICVTSHSLDWSSFSTTSDTPSILSVPFDVIFGADIVYEAKHAIWIRNCLQSLLAHPNGTREAPVFHLVIPLRPTHTFESSTVEQVFGSKDRSSGKELTILSKESIVCNACEVGRDDDVEYVYYRIGWTQ